MYSTFVLVNYDEIDTAIGEIRTLLEDVSYTLMLEELNSVFEYSQSDYVDKLKLQASNLTEINNVVNDLLAKTKEMLDCAKRIYMDTDLNVKKSIENIVMDS